MEIEASFEEVGRGVERATAFGDHGVELFDAVGHLEARFGMPAGAVEYQDDDAILTGAGLAGEERQNQVWPSGRHWDDDPIELVAADGVGAEPQRRREKRPPEAHHRELTPMPK